MSKKSIGMTNNDISYINYISNDSSPFMIEYYNKRMKMWHPYADIILNNNTDVSSYDNSSNLYMLIKAIQYVENQ
jgi:hypothetical protein